MILGQHRHRDIGALGLHRIEHAADIVGIEIRAQRPAGVEIAEHHRQIGQVREHHPLVVEAIREIDALAIDRDRDLARDRQLEPGRGDHDIGGQEAVVRQPHAALLERLDLAGDDLGLAALDRVEQIVVGHQAQPLVPRIVGRGEGGAVELVAQRLLDLLVEELLHLLGLGARALEADVLHLDVLPAGQAVGRLLGQELAQQVRQPVLRRAREHPGRGALEHGDLGGLARHRRRDRHRGGARADHHHLLAGIVEIVGPELRVDHLAFEGAEIEAGVVGLVVIVIARAQIEEIGGEPLVLAPILFGTGLDLHRPARGGAVEIGGDNLVAQPDVLANAALVDDTVEIVEDRGRVGDRFLVLPGFEIEPQRVHVAVRANPGIAEQVPGAAQIVAPFENRIAGVRRFGGHMRGHPDPGNPRPHDQHVEMAGLFGHLCSPNPGSEGNADPAPAPAPLRIATRLG